MKNILVVFFRKIRNSDIYSLINLTGLAVGIAACLIIFLFVRDEFQYDRHHEDAGNIYRLLMHNPRTGGEVAIQPGAMYPYLSGQVPGVKAMGRVIIWTESILNSGDEPMLDRGMLFADSTILDILSFDFIKWSPASALENSRSIILTSEAAEKYFGDEDPMGQTLLFDNEYYFIVSGVIENPPGNSHLDYTMISSIESVMTLNSSALTNWGNSSSYYYFRLSPEADPRTVEESIKTIVWENNEHFRDNVHFRLQPLLDIRLRSHHIEWDWAQTGNITVVMIFSAVALLILALACFNFINLSIATAIRRAREIGVKKVLGASRGKLVFQFITETFVLAFFATLIALLLAEVLLPTLNNLSGKQLSVNLFSDPVLPLLLVILLFIISIVAGGYPAMVMSRFKAVSAMKGVQHIGNIKGLKSRRYQFRMRQLLTLLQFAVSTALIVSSLMILLQMKYISDRNPGYEREGLIAVRNPLDEHGPMRATYIKEQLSQRTGVVSVSLAHNTPPNTPNNYTRITYEAGENSQSIHSALNSVDAGFFSTLKARIIQGRDFSKEMATDAVSATIINQTLASRLGLEDPVGEWIGGFYDGQSRQVIGVVEDIHFASMHEPAGPMAFFINEESYPQNWFNMLVRYEAGTSEQLIGFLEETWKEEAAQWPLIYNFVDDQFMEHYRDDRRMMLIMAGFAGLAILLSILGLLGLAVYSAATRTREIGIRKVMGASVFDITRLITIESGVLVLVSNIVAWPAAYLFINRWLDNFEFRTDISWAAFILPALFVFAAAMVTVGLISYRSATTNPAVTLQTAD